MHKSLAEALQLRITVVSVCHLREVGIHAGIPATEALHALVRLEILDVVALTGGANEGTGSAAQTGGGKLLPLGRIEECFCLIAAEGVCRQIVQGQLIQTVTDQILLCIHRGGVAFLRQSIQLGKQRLTLFGEGIQIQRILRLVADDVTAGGGCIDTEGAAEAGLGGLVASHRNDDTVLPAVFIVGVNGIDQENPVQNLKASYVAGAYAEDHKILALLTGVDHLDGFSFHLEIHQILGLGEEEILSGANGVQRIAHLHAVFPLGEVGTAIGAVNRQI